ncbi:N-acetylneuraminate synthase family protein [Brachybacterium sp. GPGPB12]|uniref:N-acetylneuraminate synthase family protein n=1 Tax=Brachybacterium sp. GPGPB12 TaxID=3023517 RepID=UPI0031342FCC
MSFSQNGTPKSLRIGDLQVGETHAPFVAAEMSGNHNGDLGRALAIVDAIAETGAPAIKLQTYTADTITIDADGPAFRITDSHGLWGGRNLYSLYQEAHTPWEWHEAIFARAREHGMIPFSSPFDDTAVDLLEDLGAQVYKIASLEIGDIPLLRARWPAPASR